MKVSGGFINKGFKGEHGGFWKFVIWSTLLLFVLLVCAKGNNLYRWVQAEFIRSGQEKQIEQYKSNISAMQDSIRLLKSNRDSLEKYARETFYFAGEDEDVYIIGD